MANECRVSKLRTQVDEHRMQGGTEILANELDKQEGDCISPGKTDKSSEKDHKKADPSFSAALINTPNPSSPEREDGYANDLGRRIGANLNNLFERIRPKRSGSLVEASKSSQLKESLLGFLSSPENKNPKKRNRISF